MYEANRVCGRVLRTTVTPKGQPAPTYAPRNSQVKGPAPVNLWYFPHRRGNLGFDAVVNLQIPSQRKFQT
jgi:hypothetical protein